jgi:hypothetical protein
MSLGTLGGNNGKKNSNIELSNSGYSIVAPTDIMLEIINDFK